MTEVTENAGTREASHCDKCELFFKNRIEVLFCGSRYSSILCYRMNIHLTWLCRKLLDVMVAQRNNSC